jgi:protein phosphatase
VILYSLGSENQPKIDLFELLLQPRDVLLLCSDGLTRHVADEEIAEILGNESPEMAASKLIELANQRGGEDNISAAVIHFNGYAESATAVTKPQATATRQPQANKQFLWVYTGVLAIVLIFLILLTWLVLRV